MAATSLAACELGTRSRILSVVLRGHLSFLQSLSHPSVILIDRHPGTVKALKHQKLQSSRDVSISVCHPYKDLTLTSTYNQQDMRFNLSLPVSETVQRDGRRAMS